MAEWRIEEGDCLEVLKRMEDGSVHCCVTSPPYFGLRDYGCAGQIGLEASPSEYVAALVRVFAEVRRVLRDDGTLWLNIGDSYNAQPGQRKVTDKPGTKQATNNGSIGAPSRSIANCKPKDLIGIPWMLAFALRDDGWYLRSEIIWAKKSPMPESVRDRPTKAHEQVFLLTKRPTYFYDAAAIREPLSRGAAGSTFTNGKTGVSMGERCSQMERHDNPDGRNKWSVWWLGNEPFAGAHFATFPTKLVEPCIKAGASEHGCCPTCLAPWVRIVQKEIRTRSRPNEYVKRTGETGTGNSCANTVAGVSVETIGWEPSCKCPVREPIPCTVLDPFAGAGTTILVARRLGRRGVGIELNPQYAEMARKRITEDLPLFNSA